MGWSHGLHSSLPDAGTDVQTHVVPSPMLPQPPQAQGLSAPWVLLQKLQQQQVVQQRQLEKQLQLLQQQQQMLLPGRGPGEGVPTEPREPRLSQGSVVQPSQSSGPLAHPEDLANGMVSMDPAVPAAAEGVCRWEQLRCGDLCLQMLSPRAGADAPQMRLQFSWGGGRCRSCPWITVGTKVIARVTAPKEGLGG